MIDSQVRTNDVHDRRIIAALSAVPREIFLPESRKALAYVEAAVETGPGRHLWEARDFAKLLLLTEVAETDRVRRDLRDIRVVSSMVNRGFAGGSNLGIGDLEGVDYVALVNNDATVAPGWSGT